MATQSKAKAPPKAPKPLTPAQRTAQQNKQAAQQRKYQRAQAAQRAQRRAKVKRTAAAPGKGAELVTQRKAYGGKHMLTAELLIGVAIVAVRAVADYEPQADGTLKGKVGHPKGQYGPLPILAGLIVSFFLLSFLAASGGLKAKLAVIAGGIIDLALLMNSSAEFEKVTATFGTFGKAKVPKGAWQTTGTAAGEPVAGSLPAAGGGTSGGTSGGAKLPPGLPAGSTSVSKDGACPGGTMKIGIGKDHDGGPFFCTPVAG